jgi:nitroimidazol reductase NimA-like FMN-containing flavoprotein (pyridoxamine 5'-phosphate oxidase superfamily)
MGLGGREPSDPAPVWYEAVMWVAMSAAERGEFLASVNVGVLSAAIGTAGQTLAVPVWYSYQPGGLLTVLTGRRSRKAAAIRAAGRFGLCVQDASPPYRYVSVEGPVVREEELDSAERLAMARRYLGAAGGDQYVAENPDPGRENVAFRMRPEHWLSQDQAKGQAPGSCSPLASSDVPSSPYMRRYQRRDSTATVWPARALIGEPAE